MYYLVNKTATWCSTQTEREELPVHPTLTRYTTGCYEIGQSADRLRFYTQATAQDSCKHLESLHVFLFKLSVSRCWLRSSAKLIRWWDMQCLSQNRLWRREPWRTMTASLGSCSFAEIFITSITSHRKEGYRPQKQEVDLVPQGEERRVFLGGDSDDSSCCRMLIRFSSASASSLEASHNCMRKRGRNADGGCQSSCYSQQNICLAASTF